jgi:ribosome biogenesis GTPase A
MGFWPVVKKVVKECDFVLEIVDARMPGYSRNRELESLVRREGKELIVVANKIDLVSAGYLKFVRENNGDYYFVSGKRNRGISELKKGILIKGKRKGLKDVKVGVVGYPNVGKSAVINALAKRGKARVTEKAGTTRGIQWVRAGGLLVLDSPGVVRVEDDEVKLGILGAKNPEKLRNLDKVVHTIINKIVGIDKKILEKLYGVEIDGMDEDEIILEIGKKKGFLLKKGRVDEQRVMMKIIKDWQKGKFRF